MTKPAKPWNDMVLVNFKLPDDMVIIPGMYQTSWQFGDRELVRLYYDKTIDGEPIKALIKEIIHNYHLPDSDPPDVVQVGGLDIATTQRGGLS